MATETLKCVVVGDGNVGKTCLLIRYAKDEFSLKYIPTIFDSYTVNIPVGGECYRLNLCDTAGQEDYDMIRKFALNNTDVIIICFAVNSHASLNNIRDLWIPEIKRYCPGIPYMLVGTKSDLRNDEEYLKRKDVKIISSQEGLKLAKEINALAYLECSAITKENVSDVFHEAILLAITDEPTLTSKTVPTKTTSKSKLNKMVSQSRTYFRDKCNVS